MDSKGSAGNGPTPHRGAKPAVPFECQRLTRLAEVHILDKLPSAYRASGSTAGYIEIGTRTCGYMAAEWLKADNDAATTSKKTLQTTRGATAGKQQRLLVPGCGDGQSGDWAEDLP